MKRILYITILLGAILMSAVSSLKWRQISDVVTTLTEINYLHGITGKPLTRSSADSIYNQIANNIDPHDSVWYKYETYHKDTIDSKLSLKTTPTQVIAEITAESESVILKDMNAMGLSTIKMIPIYSYHFLAANAAIADGDENFVVYRVNKTITLTGFKFILSTQGNYTPDNYNGISISSISGTTTTLIASTPNDTGDPNMWEASVNTLRTRDLSTPVVLTPGLYAIHSIYNSSSGTAPSLYLNGVTSSSTSTFGMTVKASSKKTAVTTPSTGVDISTTTGVGSLFGIWGY